MRRISRIFWLTSASAWLPSAGVRYSCRMPEPKNPAEISALLREDRVFTPPESFRARANVRDNTPYEEADRDFEGFWARLASELEWSRQWTKVLDWNPPDAKWFVDGQLNASVNCVDRHIR